MTPHPIYLFLKSKTLVKTELIRRAFPEYGSGKIHNTLVQLSNSELSPYKIHKLTVAFKNYLSELIQINTKLGESEIIETKTAPF